MLGPLFDDYEATMALLRRDLEQTKAQFKTQLQDCQVVVLENDQLREQLAMAKREYLRIVEENRDHASIARPNKADGEGAGAEAPAGGENPGQASSEEIMELKNRAHLLSEEN